MRGRQAALAVKLGAVWRQSAVYCIQEVAGHSGGLLDTINVTAGFVQTSAHELSNLAGVHRGGTLCHLDGSLCGGIGAIRVKYLSEAHNREA